MGQPVESTVRSYLRAFNERDHDAIRDHVADDVVHHGIHEDLEGPDALLEYLERHFQAFPDYRGDMERLIADADCVCVRYTAAGTHTGEYEGVEPTGLAATWSGLAMYRVEDGEIAKIWIEEDRLGLLEQLEMLEDSVPAHLRL